MGDSQKFIIRFTVIVIFLITVLCPVAEVQSGSIFDFIRREKETATFERTETVTK